MRVVRYLSGVPRRWKNGGGLSWDVAVWPEGAGWDEFGWRLSMARIEAEGPFSRMDGIDRTLTLLDGDGCTLDFAGGGGVTLRRGGTLLAFPGEAPVTARLPEGPVVDLNVMSRRGRFAHAVAPVRVGRAVPEGAVALVGCEDGPASVGGVTLARGDALIGPVAGLSPSATVLAVTIREVRLPPDAPAAHTPTHQPQGDAR